MRNTSSFNILAAILMIIGGIFLLENFGVIEGAWLFWPFLPLIMGIGFCMLFFRSRKDLVLLGMGSFILLNSLFFFYLNFTAWSLLAYLWPVFIILLGITMLVCYLAYRKKVLIYLATILIALGASFILIFAISIILWPISLVFAGVSFIIINFFERISQKKDHDARKK